MHDFKKRLFMNEYLTNILMEGTKTQRHKDTKKNLFPQCVIPANGAVDLIGFCKQKPYGLQHSFEKARGFQTEVGHP
jgi:hypothetical protein